MPKRQLQGTVVSNKMEKTIVVKTERIKEHPKYRKRFKVYNKYKAHASGKQFSIGDVVIIEETRPISKDKKWMVLNKKTKLK